jgi:hypothetical protein
MGEGSESDGWKEKGEQESSDQGLGIRNSRDQEGGP